VPGGPSGLYADASEGFNAGVNAETYVPQLNNLAQWAATNATQSPNLGQANAQILYGQNQQAGTTDWWHQMASEGNALYKDATTGTGLFPAQQAMVNQAQNAEQTQVASQLGAEGLASSTAAPILQGEVAQQAAATAGQLEQGNLQLAQGYQQMALGGQQLNAQQQTALEQEAAGLQNQNWTQALQGYGVLGQMIQTALQGFGVSISANQAIEQASIATAADQAGMANAQASASGSALGGLGQGLGSLLGGSSGSGGGLLGSLGSSIGGLFGGGGSAAAGAAGSAGGAVAGGGSSLFAAAGALFGA
jgi:hypothetical protein